MNPGDRSRHWHQRPGLTLWPGWTPQTRRCHTNNRACQSNTDLSNQQCQRTQTLTSTRTDRESGETSESVTASDEPISSRRNSNHIIARFETYLRRCVTPRIISLNCTHKDPDYSPRVGDHDSPHVELFTLCISPAQPQELNYPSHRNQHPYAVNRKSLLAEKPPRKAHITMTTRAKRLKLPWNASIKP